MSKYHSLKLWPYAMTSFLYYGFIGCFISYLAILLTARGFDSVEIGAVFALYTLARIVMGQVVAYFSDKTQDHLSFYRYGLIGAIFFLIPCLFIVSQIELLCLDAANGDAVVYNRIRIFGSLGFVVCAILMGQILDAGSHITIIYFGLAVLFIGYLSSQKMVNYEHDKDQQTTQGDFLKKCLSPVFVAFLVSSILLHTSFAPFVGFFTQYLSLSGYEGIEVGLLFSLGAIAEMALFLFAGAILSRVGIKKLLLFGFLVTALRWYLQGRYIDNLTIVILTQCLHAFSFGLMHSVSVHFIRHYFEPAQQGIRHRDWIFDNRCYLARWLG